MIKKGTGYFSFRSSAGHVDEMCWRAQTSTQSVLANPPYRTVFTGSQIHELNSVVVRPPVRLDSNSFPLFPLAESPVREEILFVQRLNDRLDILVDLFSDIAEIGHLGDTALH